MGPSSQLVSLEECGTAFWPLRIWADNMGFPDRSLEFGQFPAYMWTSPYSLLSCLILINEFILSQGNLLCLLKNIINSTALKNNVSCSTQISSLRTPMHCLCCTLSFMVHYVSLR